MEFTNTPTTISQELITTYVTKLEEMENVVRTALETDTVHSLNSKLASLTTDSTTKFAFETKDTQISKWTQGCTILFLTIAIFVGCISGAILWFSDDVLPKYSLALAASLVLAFGNCFILANAHHSVKENRKINLLVPLLNMKGIDLIENLARYTNQTPQAIIGILTKAVKRKQIPHGHFSDDNVAFMVSNIHYAKYGRKRTVYNDIFQKNLKKSNQKQAFTKELVAQTYLSQFLSQQKINSPIHQKLTQIEVVLRLVEDVFQKNTHDVQYLQKSVILFHRTMEPLLAEYRHGKYPHRQEKQVRKENIALVIDCFLSCIIALYQEYMVSVNM